MMSLSKSAAKRKSSMSMMSPKQAFFKKLNKVIERNLSNSELSIELLAEEMNISRSHLHRLLKKFVKLSASNYVRLYRIKAAAIYLQQSNNSVSEIAYHVGFRNLSYFSKSFKEVFKKTPAEFRDYHNNKQ